MREVSEKVSLTRRCETKVSSSVVSKIPRRFATHSSQATTILFFVVEKNKLLSFHLVKKCCEWSSRMPTSTDNASALKPFVIHRKIPQQNCNNLRNFWEQSNRLNWKSKEKLMSSRLDKYLSLSSSSRATSCHIGIINRWETRNAFREWLGISMWIERDLWAVFSIFKLRQAKIMIYGRRASSHADDSS